MYITYNCNMEYLEIGSKNFKTKNIIYVSELRGGEGNSYFYLTILLKNYTSPIEIIFKYNIEQKDHTKFTEIMKGERNRLNFALRHNNFVDGVFFDKDKILNELTSIKN